MLRDAYASAGVDPAEVQFVETHGTGTMLGDPIEAGSLGAVLGRDRPAERTLLLGAVIAFGLVPIAPVGIPIIAAALAVLLDGRSRV